MIPDVIFSQISAMINSKVFSLINTSMPLLPLHKGRQAIIEDPTHASGYINTSANAVSKLIDASGSHLLHLGIDYSLNSHVLSLEVGSPRPNTFGLLYGYDSEYIFPETCGYKEVGDYRFSAASIVDISKPFELAAFTFDPDANADVMLAQAFACTVPHLTKSMSEDLKDLESEMSNGIPPIANHSADSDSIGEPRIMGIWYSSTFPSVTPATLDSIISTIEKLSLHEDSNVYDMENFYIYELLESRFLNIYCLVADSTNLGKSFRLVPLTNWNLYNTPSMLSGIEKCDINEGFNQYTARLELATGKLHNQLSEKVTTQSISQAMSEFADTDNIKVC